MPVRLVLAVAGAALVGGFGLATPACASVAPTEATRDGDVQVAFQVPSERDNADTVVDERKLDPPADSHGKEISEVVRKITWSAQSAGAGVKHEPEHLAALKLEEPGSDADQPAAAGGIGSGRFVPTAAAVVGLIGVVLGGLALARSAGRTGTGNRRRAAVAAGVAGLIAVVAGGLHLANSAGGFGTGNGRAAAIAAMVVGLISTVLGGLVLARSRRTG